jgi:hypothetical protein
LWGFRGGCGRAFGPDGERKVSATGPVWFRNNGRARASVRGHHLGESRHQSKIYTESNQSDFSEIFGDFTSMQTLAIYRRLIIQNGLPEIGCNRVKTDG